MNASPTRVPAPKRDTAFLVMHLDVTVSPPRIRDIALFSEEYPTTRLKQYRQFTVAVGYGHDYTEGVESIRAQAEGPVKGRFDWCIPFMDTDTVQRLGLVERRKVRAP